MPTENVTTKFKVDISDLKKNITDANKQIQLATAEFKNATAGMDNWAKSADGLSAKIQQQEKIVDAEKKKLEALKTQLQRLNTNIQNGESVIADLTRKHEEAARQYGETSDEAKAYAKQLADAQKAQERNQTAAEKLNIQIINQDTAVKNAESQLGRYQTALAENANTTETLTQKVQRQQSELDALKQKYINVAVEQGQSSDEAQELARRIESLSGELQTNRTRLNEASDAADDFDHSLEEVDNEADNTTNGGLAAFGVALGNLAADLISAAISKMKDLITETVNVGKAFDSSMSQVGAVSGATGDELQLLRDKAKEMGSTTKFTASEAADAFNYMAMAGWKTEDMISGIDGILNLAAASGADLATTSDIVTDALTAMGYSAADAGRLADVMAAASSNANTNVEMMGHTFQYAAPIVGALGYNMEDTAVAIGLMANAGIKADKAGTALRSILTRLSAPPKECAEAMNQYGISITDSQGNMKSLDEIMRDLRKTFDGMSETEQTAAAKHLAGAEAMSGLLAIVNAAPADYAKLTDAVANSSFSIDAVNNSLENSGIQWENYSDKAWMANGGIEGLADEIIYNVDKIGTSTDDLREYLESEYDMNAEDAIKAIEAVTGAMDDSEGAAERMANTMLDNLGGDMTLLSSKLEGVQLAIYEKFEPALRKGVEALDKLLDVVQFVVDHSTEFTAALAAMGAAMATYIGFTTAMKIMTDGWKALTIVTKAQAAAQAVLNAVTALSPWMWVVTGIMALVAAFVVLWNKSEKFRNFWIGLWEKIKEVAGVAWQAISGFFAAAWDKAKEIWGAVSGFFSGLWGSVKESAMNLIDSVVGFFTGAWNAIKSVWNTVSTWFNDHVITPIKNFFAPIVAWFSQLFGSIWNTIKSVFEVIGQLAAGCVELIKVVWGAVSGWFNTNVVQPVVNFFSTMWETIKNAASTAWNFIVSVWTVVSGWFNTHIIQPVSNFFSTMWNGIKTAASTAWNFIKGIWAVVSGWFNSTIIQPVVNFFSNMWGKLKNGAKSAWDGIKNVFSSVAEFFRKTFQTAWEKVKGVFSVGGKIFDGIKDGIVSAFKNVVNAIIRGINKVVAIPFNAINGILDKIQGIDVLGVQPFKNLTARIGVPQIPELATGGIVKRPTLAEIGENGAEAIIPLEKNKGGLKRIAQLIASEMKQSGVGFGEQKQGDTINNYNFNQTNNSPKALSRWDVYRQTRNLMNAFKIQNAEG